MLVRATKLGYYDNRRQRVGDVFDLRDEKLFSERWMQRVDISVQPEQPRKQTKKDKEFKPHDDNVI